MRALTMDYHLTIGSIARRAATLWGDKPVVARGAGGEIRRGTWGETIIRARRLGRALHELGVRPGDRVATLCWNQQEHLDAYFGVPMMGAILHTLNPRLSDADLADLITVADTRTVIVDASLLDLLSSLRGGTPLSTVIAIGDCSSADALDYDTLLDSVDPEAFAEHRSDERDACTLCFTSGTSGRPKGVLYSHRVVALQSLTTMAADFGGISESDTVLIVVPMFHGNAWNHPYASALAGATPVLPYSDIQPESLLELIESEGVTTTGGVPTVWHDVLGVLDRDPRRFDLSSLRLLRIGGSAVSESLLHGLEERHGVPIAVGFGMTEIGPMGGLWNAKDAQRIVAGTALPPRTMTGRPAPFLEVRARRDGVELPWDGESVGELEYRGASVSDGYWNVAGADNFTEDGWLRSGDLGTIGSQGVIQIHDRAKDMVKSGGEWISSVALEEALVKHPGVAEAAVVAIPHPRWQERPLAVVVVEPGQAVTSEQLLEHLARHVPRWWLPDRFEVVDEIPRSPAGKILKRNLRDRFSEA